jgi:hypothetical protein
MDVHQSFRKGIHQYIGHDPHPSGHHHNVHLLSLKEGNQLTIEGFSIRVATMVNHFDRNAKAISPLVGAAVFVVNHQKWNVCPKASGLNGLDDRFKIASITGGHHSDP